MVVGEHGERLQQLAQAPVVPAAGQALPEGGHGGQRGPLPEGRSGGSERAGVEREVEGQA